MTKPADPRADAATPEHLQRPPREQRFDAVLADYLSQIDGGAEPDRRAFLAAHPDLSDDLAAYFEVQDRMQRLAGSQHDGGPGSAGSPPPAFEGPSRARPVMPPPAGAAVDAPLPPGSLLGQYRLGAVIGEGGMGRVYQATHLHLDRQLAVKVLAPRLARDPALVQRFQREARALARLTHPHVVGIHDMGSQGDVHYFVMEFVGGRNLRQLMGDGDVTPERALAIVRAVCDALGFAHAEGLVHRDVKPENVLLDEAGTVRIADFGLAKVLQDEARASAGLTASHVVLGTYNYMAPEQKQTARVDHRADLFAVGVMLYELLTGQLPDGNFDLPSRRSAVGPGVDRIVMKALQADPERRYQSAAELAEDLGHELQDGDPGRAPRPAPTPLPDVLQVSDRSGEQQLGSGQAGWLRLVMRCDDDLEVRAWPQPFIGVASDSDLAKGVTVSAIDAPSSPWIGTGSDARPGLCVELPRDDVQVYVPEGLPVVVVSEEGDIDVGGLRAPLRIDPGEGDVRVRDHQGSLTVDRLEDGDVRIQGLDSRSFQISTREGDLALTGLRFMVGEGRLHTDDGDLMVGVVEEGSAFDFDLRAANGSLTCDFADVPRHAATVRGSTGVAGRAHLSADSYAGAVHLGESQSVDRTLSFSESVRGAGCGALLIAFCFWQDWDVLAFILLACWAADIGWRHLFWKLSYNGRRLLNR